MSSFHFALLSKLIALFTMILILLLLAASPTANARDRGREYTVDSANGWMIGRDHEAGGYGVYRQSGRGWQRMPGSGVRIGGNYDNPWLINNRYEIYQWNGHRWLRMPGTAQDVIDGWVIGTDRRAGGYGIYRWNGSQWLRMPGGAVEIGGNYEHPWVINDRGEYFEWRGADWHAVRSHRRRF